MDHFVTLSRLTVLCRAAVTPVDGLKCRRPEPVMVGEDGSAVSERANLPVASEGNKGCDIGS